MCGRFVQYSDPEVYASCFDLDALCEATPRYNVAPTQPVVTVQVSESGTRELVKLRWGLVPAWSDGPDNRYSMINAVVAHSVPREFLKLVRADPAGLVHRCFG